MACRTCIAAADGATVPLGAYKTSMMRLLEYVGLTGYGTEQGSMPERSDEERALITTHLERVIAEDAEKQERLKGKLWRSKKGPPNTVMEAVQGGGGPHGNPTIYLSFEESVEWKSFLLAIPPASRHLATVRRRLSLSLWRAHCRGLCLWCWFPANLCLCPTLDQLRTTLPHNSLERSAAITMILHCEEVMRSTNSGHIAAYLLDAPIRVWGCREDDEYLKTLPLASREVMDGVDVVTYNAALYPESNAASITEFIHTMGQCEETKRPDSAAAHDANDRAPENAQQRAHLLLFDSTWGQALSLNRHVNRGVPRVGLDLDEEYESLFVRLRKRTREGGVSTLEATSMAVEQCIAAMGQEADARQISSVLTEGMKAFVDLKCVLKFTEAEFNKDADVLDDLTTRRDAVRSQEAALRYQEMNARVKTDAKARALLLPPVLNYCYCCDRVIGWHRMAEHVLGRTHRQQRSKNPTCEPSEASRQEKVLDYERPPRRKVNSPERT